MKGKKKVRKSSAISRDLRALMDQYAAATGKTSVNLYKVAEWAIANSLYTPPPTDIRKRLARDMAAAAREDYIEDDNGEPVRRRHAYKTTLGEDQLTLWVNIEDATPHEMRLCVNGRRRGIQSDVEQLHRDVTHVNKKYNPGDPIQPSFDFTKDVEEKGEPTEYIDAPPEEPQDDTDAPPVA